MTDPRVTTEADHGELLGDQAARLLDGAPFGMFTADVAGAIDSINDEAASLLGISLHSNGRSPATPELLADLLANPADALLLDDALKKALAGDQVRRSFELHGRDGSQAIHFRFWSDGALTDVALVMVDRASPTDHAAELKSLIERSPKGMARLTASSSVVDLNGRWAEITGQNTVESLGQGWLKVIDPDGRAEFLEALEQANEAGTGLHGRLRVIEPSGAKRWIELSTIPLGQPGNALVTFEDVTDERDAVQRATELSRMLEATKDLIGILKPDGSSFLWANDALTRLTRTPIGESSLDHVMTLESVRILFDEAVPRVLAGKTWSGELDLVTAEVHTTPVSATLLAHYDDAGSIEAISFVAQDITDVVRAREEARAEETLLTTLVERAGDIALLVDDKGELLRATPSSETTLGYETGALVGTHVIEIVHPDDLETVYGIAQALVAEPNVAQNATIRVAHGDGSFRSLEIAARNLTEREDVRGFVLNATDITERLAVSERVEHSALVDSLTGLANRATFLDHLTQALNSTNQKNLMTGVFLLGLDRFKIVNDSLGHDAGDQLLRVVAERITSITKQGDVVARLSGDEFAVMMPEILRRGEAVTMARSLRRAVTEPIEIGGRSTVVTTSIGIAISDDSSEAPAMLGDAAAALHQAKDQGRDIAIVFDDQLRDRALRRLDVEGKLRRAIRNDDLVVHYQPVFRAKDQTLIGAEALVRIRNSDGSLVMPGEFIEVAEDSGLIASLGEQVLAKSVEQAAAWTAEGSPDRIPLSVAVNVSARQLTDPTYAATLASRLDDIGLAASQLSLELTESALIESDPVSEDQLHQLSKLGVRIGLDDFGTGFSSLAYLKRFPISFLKVDRSFVSGLGSDDDDSAIVRATIALAKSLNLRIVAEGVETEDQLDELRKLGCDWVQGYLFSKPVSTDEFATILARG